MGKSILFQLFRIFAFLLGKMPFWLLYFKSNMLAFLLHRVIRYRKKVILNNLRRCFPEKSGNELNQITKQFYKHLADITLETFKGFYMSEEQLKKRWKVLNPEILENYFASGRNIINLASHYGNWEWGILALNMQIQHQAVSIYKPLTNTAIEQWSKKKRERFGMQMVPIKETRDFFASKQELPMSIIMAADQHPTNRERSIMTKFFKQDTPCLHGPEAYALTANIPLVYFNVQRVKRGHYTLEIIDLIPEPKQAKYSEITQVYISKVEEIIRKNPNNYLWSHRRWKHSKQEIDEMLRWHEQRVTAN